MNFYVKYIIILATILTACGEIHPVVPFSSSSEVVEVVNINVLVRPSGGGLAGDGQDADALGLVSASAFNVSLTGCSSGYTATVTQANTTLTAYIHDRNCLVKLNSFTANSVAYTPSTTHPFTTWQPGDYTYFQDASSNLIFVTIVSTLSSPVLSTNTVVMNFGGGPTAGTTKNVLTDSESSLGGNHVDSGAYNSPTYQLKVASLSSISGTNIAGLTITLACTTLMSSNKCNSVTLPSGDASFTVTYGFTPAISLTQTYTTTQLNNVTLSTTGSVLAPGASSGGVTITNGGFVTTTGGVSVDLTGSGYVTFIQKIVQISGGAYTYNYWNVFVGEQSPAGSVSACSTTFSGGTGTSTNPYLISNATQLGFVNTGACASNSIYFQQINNIDLGGAALTAWTSVNLTGQYNGNGYSITGLYQTLASGSGGVFGTLNSGGSISNLTVANVNLSASGNVTMGALVGTIAGGTVTNCQSSGSISLTALAATGGLIGYISGASTVSYASSSVNISINDSSGTTTSYGVQGSAVGGLLGAAATSTATANISNSSASGNISVSNLGTGGTLVVQLGALAGSFTTSSSSTISNSYSTGNITVSASGSTVGNLYFGMVATLSNSGTISGCFSIGTYSTTIASNGPIWASGMVGLVQGSNSGTITNSYTMVSVSVNNSVTTSFNTIGGFFTRGNGSSTVSITTSYSADPSITGTNETLNSFYGSTGGTLTTTNDYYYANGSVPDNQNGSGITHLSSAAAMQTQSNFTGFNFSTVWTMPTANPNAPSGLLSPVLQWQCGLNGVVCSSICNSSSFASGSGTSGSPYIVSNAWQLLASTSCTSSTTYFQQSQNINIGGSSFPSWVPEPFSGQYNGNNYMISNLYVNNSTGGVGSGLFSIINGSAAVSNLTLSNVNITAVQYIGALAGLLGSSSASASVTNCSSSGTIQLNTTASQFLRAGGIIGEVTTGTVSSSSSSVNVTWAPSSLNGADNVGIGGLIGVLRGVFTSSSVTNSFATGSVNTSSGTTATAQFGSGSLIGLSSGGTTNTISITNSYATGNQTHLIDATTSTGKIQGYGGIVGFVLDMSNTTVSGCYSSGTYSAVGTANNNIQMGGLIGWVAAATSGASVSNSYTMATITTSGTHGSGIGTTGGFIGNPFGISASSLTISSSYSANPSITSTGVAVSDGFFGAQGSNAPTVSNSYYYHNASTPANVFTTGVTSYTTTTQMQTQTNFSGLTFGTASTTNWQMPVSNSIASPTTLLSPVLQWQCTANGTVHTATCL